ncbi:MAG: hypothetical protein HY784_05125 [Chloroflexi bacterium]|nr:hypothetical protein [Chloroflexota bacterium]
MGKGGQYRGGPPPGPKPYDFVPFAEVSRREVRYGAETLWAGEGYFSGELEFSLRALSPVFVAAGRYALSEEAGLGPGGAVRGFCRTNGVPTIPASTLKGVVRGVAEAVSPSHVTATRLDVGDLDRTGDCAVGPGKKACPACALFGGGGRQAHIGLVRFEDARLVGSTKTRLFRLSPLYAPRATRRGAPAAYTDEHGELKGRKFYFHGQPAKDPGGDHCEVLPAGAQFSGRLCFANLDGPLLGLVFFALGFDRSFRLNLGGGKPLCLGSVEFAPVRLRLLGREEVLSGEAQGEPVAGEALADFIVDKMRSAQQARLLLGPQVTKLCEVLRWPNARQAPGGAY